MLIKPEPCDAEPDANEVASDSDSDSSSCSSDWACVLSFFCLWHMPGWDHESAYTSSSFFTSDTSNSSVGSEPESSLGYDDKELRDLLDLSPLHDTMEVDEDIACLLEDETNHPAPKRPRHCL